MNIFQLLDALAVRKNIEVVISRLPEWAFGTLHPDGKRQRLQRPPGNRQFARTGDLKDAVDLLLAVASEFHAGRQTLTQRVTLWSRLS